ncbi:hypothetical protein JVT61DRAFT_4800 [Boletus reticuloceps]|uniref:Uncharacterized protein n=1 Tax=Boletus reticuloceps TaxID=495285 RepID=A0A8I2YN72_9AGAM|nr:hypothetical protein JVT61DRAFT_4800 [Boletus reticuloceps]
MECPILVWMLSLNRDVTTEEYDKCYNLVRECSPHARIAYDCTSIESFHHLTNVTTPHDAPQTDIKNKVEGLRNPKRETLDRAGLSVQPSSSCASSASPKVRSSSSSLFPHPRRIATHNSLPMTCHPEKFLQSMIGYHLTYENSLCGMVMTQGRQRQVINIGLGIKQLCVEPRGVTVAAYAESFAHKLTPLEMTFVSPELGDEVVLRRLCILLSLKAAYIKAVGQSRGFDWSRLEFNIPNESARGDDHPLQGWEFRVFKAKLGVQRGGTVIEESYQCACAFFRGTKESKFIWHDNAKDLEAWVQFINIDQMIKVIPKLTA